MFLDVSFEWDEVLVDEVRKLLIRVGLSFQLSTCPSGRCRREIDQQRLILTLGVRQRGVGIRNPIYQHIFTPYVSFAQKLGR